MSKIKGTTKSGFEYKIDKEVFDNMEFLEILTEADDNDPVAATKIVKFILGEKQKQKLYDHLRDDDGVVHVSAVFEAVGEIFDQIKALKN